MDVVVLDSLVVANPRDDAVAALEFCKESFAAPCFLLHRETSRD